MMFRLSRNRMETTLYHKNTLNNSPESHPDCSEKKGKQLKKKKNECCPLPECAAAVFLQ